MPQVQGEPSLNAERKLMLWAILDAALILGLLAYLVVPCL